MVKNRIKIPITLREDVSVQHIVSSDISSETIQRTRGCVSMATLAIFITLGTATCVGQRYNGNSQLRFHGNSADANASQRYVISTFPSLSMWPE
jgi:hypothetical protein